MRNTNIQFRILTILDIQHTIQLYLVMLYLLNWVLGSKKCIIDTFSLSEIFYNLKVV